MSMDKQQASDALEKPLKEITDKELNELLNIPELFYPHNDRAYSHEMFVVELTRRKRLTDADNAELDLVDMMFITQARLMLSWGPNLYAELDKFGRERLREIMNKRIQSFNERQK